MSSYRRTAVVAVVFLSLIVAARLRLQPPAARPTTAPPSEFSAARAIAEFRETIGGTVPHPVGSAENRAVKDRIVARFRSLGYETSVDARFVCDAHGFCANVENILARPPATRPLGPSVLLVCHYDSVPAGPGASDDGAGVAAALEIARALRDAHFRNPVAFLVDDGEEAGLLGAEAFVAAGHAPIAVGAMVNIEARGTSGPSFLFETSGENLWFLPPVGRALHHPITSSLFAAVYDRLPNDTDLTIFKRAGLPGVNFAFAGDVGNYHTPRDDVRHLDARSIQHQGDNALQALRAFADADLTSRPRGNAVWFDLLGLTVLWWPARFTLYASIASALLALLTAYRLAGRRDFALGLGCFAATMVAAPGLAYCVAAAAGISANWAAWPQPLIVAMWLTGVAVALALPRLLRGADLLAGYAVGWNLLAVPVAFYAAGASHLFVLPAVALTLALLLRFRGRSADLPGGAIALAVAALVWFPIALFLYDMLGAPGLPVIAAIAAIVATTCAPLELPLPRRTWQAALVAVAICAVAARALPPYTETHPRRLNVVYYDDGVMARWLVRSVTPELASAAAFADSRVSIADWYLHAPSYQAATAPRLPIAPVAISREGTLLRVHSQRNSDRIALMIRGPVGRLTVNGVALPPRPPRFRDSLAPGWHRVEARGTDLAVDVGTTAPLDVVALDTTFGLPAEGRALAAARDRSTAVPSDDGDVTMTARREHL